jgi:hypothetical protein
MHLHPYPPNPGRAMYAIQKMFFFSTVQTWPGYFTRYFKRSMPLSKFGVVRFVLANPRLESREHGTNIIFQVSHSCFPQNLHAFSSHMRPTAASVSTPLSHQESPLGRDLPNNCTTDLWLDYCREGQQRVIALVIVCVWKGFVRGKTHWARQPDKLALNMQGREIARDACTVGCDKDNQKSSTCWRQIYNLHR